MHVTNEEQIRKLHFQITKLHFTNQEMKKFMSRMKKAHVKNYESASDK